MTGMQLKPMTGTQLREMREYYALSQAQLAQRLGVDVSTVSRWERDAREIPTYLPYAVQMIGYQAFIARNQRVIDACYVPYEQARPLIESLPEMRDRRPDTWIFDIRGDVIEWHILDNDLIYAIGGNLRNGHSYIVPASAKANLVLRQPSMIESGHSTPDLLRQIGMPLALD